MQKKLKYMYKGLAISHLHICIHERHSILASVTLCSFRLARNSKIGAFELNAAIHRTNMWKQNLTCKWCKLLISHILTIHWFIFTHIATCLMRLLTNFTYISSLQHIACQAFCNRSPTYLHLTAYSLLSRTDWSSTYLCLISCCLLTDVPVVSSWCYIGYLLAILWLISNMSSKSIRFSDWPVFTPIDLVCEESVIGSFNWLLRFLANTSVFPTHKVMEHSTFNIVLKGRCAKITSAYPNDFVSLYVGTMTPFH